MSDATPSRVTAGMPATIAPMVLSTSTSIGKEYGLAMLTLPPFYAGPPLHRHPGHAEGCYVLKGTLAVTYDSTTITLAQGTSILIPAGTMHTCWNPTAAPTTMLLIYQPGGEADDITALAACVAGDMVVYVDTS